MAAGVSIKTDFFAPRAADPAQASASADKSGDEFDNFLRAASAERDDRMEAGAEARQGAGSDASQRADRRAADNDARDARANRTADNDARDARANRAADADKSADAAKASDRDAADRSDAAARTDEPSREARGPDQAAQSQTNDAKPTGGAKSSSDDAAAAAIAAPQPQQQVKPPEANVILALQAQSEVANAPSQSDAVDSVTAAQSAEAATEMAARAALSAAARASAGKSAAAKAIAQQGAATDADGDAALEAAQANAQSQKPSSDTSGKTLKTTQDPILAALLAQTGGSGTQANPVQETGTAADKAAERILRRAGLSNSSGSAEAAQARGESANAAQPPNPIVRAAAGVNLPLSADAAGENKSSSVQGISATDARPAASTGLTSATLQHASAVQPEQNAPRASALAHEQISHEIVKRFNGDNTRFEMRLDPPELGRVEVRMEVTADNKVSATISADSPQALNELIRHSRELQQALQSAGLDLAQGGLSFDLAERQSSERQPQQKGVSSAVGVESAQEAEVAPRSRPIGIESWRGVRVDLVA